MGLFDSSYVTTVGTVTDRVIKDDKIPDAIRTGGFRALIKDTNMPETILEELGKSMGLKAARMYEYGRTKYAHGLPSGQFKSAETARAAIATTLEAIEGQPVEMKYGFLQPPNMLHEAWSLLVSNYGYNPTTNEIAGLSPGKPYPVYLDNLTIVVPDTVFEQLSPSALEQWGDPATSGSSPSRLMDTGIYRGHTPLEVDYAATRIYAKVDYCWAYLPSPVPGMLPPISRETLNLDINLLNNGLDYFQAMYEVAGQLKYWTYLDNSGVYPDLDVIFNDPADINGTFFPFAYFRYNKVSELADKNSASYLTGKKMVGFLGLDFDTVAEGINSNPDIADVEQAMMMMAVPANSTNQEELTYLFSFFEAMYVSNPGKFSNLYALQIAQQQSYGVDAIRSSLTIRDQRFKMALSNAGITKRRVGGTIGPKGTHSVTVETITIPTKYFDVDSGSLVSSTTTTSLHIYKRQISTSLYEEIRVVGLRVLYHIYGEYLTVADDEDANLLIPVDMSICEDYSIPVRERLYARSLHYIFNSRVVTEVKWYQSDFFQFLMLAVAVTITIMSFGTSVGALSAAIASGSSAAVTAALTTLLIEAVIGLAIGQLVKLVAKAIGPELSMALAAVAIAYGAYSYIGNSGVPGAPWANEMLQLASSLTKAVTENIGDAINGLKKESEELDLLGKQAEADLEKANELLKQDNWLVPIVVFGESPNDFYNRAINSSNPGIISISAISSYVDTALTLPKLDDTIGDRAYELAE